MQWVPLCILKVRHPSHSQHEQLVHHCHNPNIPVLAAAGAGILEGQAGTAGTSVSLRPKTGVVLPLHHRYYSCCGGLMGIQLCWACLLTLGRKCRVLGGCLIQAGVPWDTLALD